MRPAQKSPVIPQKNKGKLLIAVGNPYIFHGSWAPLIPELSAEYTIVIVLRDLLDRFLNHDSDVARQIHSWMDKGVVQAYFAVPDYPATSKVLRSFKSIMPQLRAFNFDIIMSDAFASAWVKYILADGIPKGCRKVVYHPNAPRLTQVGYAVESPEVIASGITQTEKRLLNTNFLERIRQARKRQNKTIPCFVFNRLKDYVYHGFRKITYDNTIMTDCIIPFLAVGRCFPKTTYDVTTGIGNNFDAAIFLEESFAEAHMKYFDRDHIYVAQHPGTGQCKCHNGEAHHDKVLTVLSTFVGSDRVPEEILSAYRRDLQSVIKETRVAEVHLRPHPRENAMWPHQLRDYLQASGIHATLVDPTRPIRDIICDYMGIVGDVSWALHDARGYCDYAFVVAFAGVVNRDALPNPRAVLGNRSGIEWVEEDGSYKKGIFERRLCEPRKYKTVAEILSELHHQDDTSPKGQPAEQDREDRFSVSVPQARIHGKAGRTSTQHRIS